MKKMRTTAIALVALISLFVLAGCGAKTPSEVVEAELKELKNEATKEVDFDAFEEGLGFDLTDAEEKQYKDSLKKIADFDYEVLGEEIASDERTATVTVKITTYDIGDAFLDALAQAIDGNTQELTSKKALEMIMANVDALEDKTYTKEVKVRCTKDDNEWETELEHNPEFIDAVSGGLRSAVESINK